MAPHQAQAWPGGYGHYTTDGAAHPSRAFLTQDRNCLLQVPLVPLPRQEGAGWKPSEPQGESDVANLGSSR